jgi:hypothetical protein
MSNNGQPPAKLRKVDPGKLKLRELAEVERQVGRRIAGELQAGDLGIDTMQALLWVTLRREHAELSYEQVGDYDMGALMDAFAGEEPADGVDPTRATPTAPTGSGS